MKLGGLILTLGTWPANGGIWFDQADDECPTAEEKPCWGLKLGLRWGPAVVWLPKWWSPRWDCNHEDNVGQPTLARWNLPWVIGPYLSICLGKVGCYVGFKDAGDPQRNRLLLSAKIDINRFWSDPANG
jgi:hypothetical protein